ncbi:CobW family GTP-binding protein [Parendozoicomonas haliclonae]|uniref:Putative GTP-binding protein YjiA n=1 Tax=Parendozoicomonas haliclonae TaxID=1960125 RepID=A0A1X7AGZ0_9GAMM|nr:CobW family GTP-binding protein [Parendozoicomonas haliclonae]SMA39399.1 putative GTP-binding protein YjiA [Parendozoicomonas haliclonae]
MSPGHKRISAVPTNIITGFLGAGKTTAIMHLMRNKPEHERWAVLVNEFGEIGVDGSLMQGQHGEEQRIFVREVPGGCMCCAAGLPMQIALNQLLETAKPDRLLIEPTGLGHPKEVLQVLSSEFYREALSLQKTLTLVDARKLSDERYTRHDTFNQQIAIADIVIGNKQDLYQDGDQERLTAYVEQHGRPDAQVLFTEQGAIASNLLQGTAASLSLPSEHHHTHKSPVRELATNIPIPECGFIKAENEGEGFRSVGWRFVPDKVFNRQKLLAFLTGLHVERMKAVFISDVGVLAYNLTPDGLTEIELDDCMESRIEMISDHLDPSWEQQLLACLV